MVLKLLLLLFMAPFYTMTPYKEEKSNSASIPYLLYDFQRIPKIQNEQKVRTSSAAPVTPFTKKWYFRKLISDSKNHTSMEDVLSDDLFSVFDPKEITATDPRTKIHHAVRRNNSNYHTLLNFEPGRIFASVPASDFEAVKINSANRFESKSTSKMVGTRNENSKKQNSDGDLRPPTTTRSNIFRKPPVRILSRNKIKRPVTNRGDKKRTFPSESARGKNGYYEATVEKRGYNDQNIDEEIEYGFRSTNFEPLRIGGMILDKNGPQNQNFKHTNKSIGVSGNSGGSDLERGKMDDDSINHPFTKIPRQKKTCRLAPGGQRRQCLKRVKKKMAKISVGNATFSSLGIPNSLISTRPDENKRTGFYGEKNTFEIYANFLPTDVKNQNQKPKSRPCSCFWSSQKCGCQCKGSLDYDDFKNLSETFRPCKNFTFSLADGHYYALPSNLFFKLTNIRNFNLIVTNATFEHLLDPTPDMSPFNGVQFSGSAMIILRNVGARRSWNWTPFQKLQGVRKAETDVLIEGCIIKRLTSDFSKIANGQVGDVSVAGSSVSLIGSSAFRTFSSMKTFRLPDNGLTTLRREDLPRTPTKLKEIDLRNNQLQYLEDNIFEGMPSLKEVSLSGNPFKVLQEKTFHDVITRVHLPGISDFPLNCDCNLQWLKDPKIDDNEIIKKNLKGAVCKKPRHLRGTPLENLSAEHLICT